MSFILRSSNIVVYLLMLAAGTLSAQTLEWRNISGAMHAAGTTEFIHTSGTNVVTGMIPGGVFRSTDHGFTWMKAGGGLPDGGITSLQYDRSNRILYAITSNASVFVCDDEGSTWYRHSSVPGGDMHLFFGAPYLYAYSDVLGLYKYSDATQSWELLYKGSSYEFNPADLAQSVGGALFMGTVSKGLYRSNDAGTTWDNVWPNDFPILGVDCFESLVLLNTENGIRVSEDLGDTWEALPHPGTSGQPALDFFAFDRESMLALEAETQQIYHTTDGGQSWHPYPAGPRMERFHFLGNGYFLGSHYADGITATTDWGATWYTSMHSMVEKGAASIHGIGDNILVGGRYITTDFGDTWMRYPEQSPQPWTDTEPMPMFYAHHLGAWYSAHDNQLWLSTDQGDTWNTVFDVAPENITSYAVQRHIARDLAICTDAGILYYFNSSTSSAGGYNSPVLLPEYMFLTSGRVLFIADAMNNMFYRSTDQGASWEAVADFEYSYDAEMYEYEPGVILFRDYLSIDNGLTWAKRDLQFDVPADQITAIVSDLRGNTFYGTNNGVYAAYKLDDNLQHMGELTHWVSDLTVLPNGLLAASTDFDGIWLTDPGTITGTPEVPSAAGSFSVSAAYPNPFVSATDFDVHLDSRDVVHVAVFDALGREVAVVHSGMLNPGTHNYTWDGVSMSGQSVPAGRYMIRVMSGGNAKTSRVVKVN
ncbi:MAG: hypothetical protein CL946_00130 [Ectothiorhodospiraceae bacterium]|nr:hypothetical protein [Ectothiorhodospiraceae bacterium]